MELNLKIIKEDLKDLDFSGHINDNPLVRRLSHPVLYNQDTYLDGNRLYVVEASQLPLELYLEIRPSFVCIGIPPEFYLSSDCNMIYTTHPDISVLSLLNRLAD